MVKVLKKVELKDLVGTWELLSFQGRNADAEAFFPFGDNPLGSLIYTDGGDMSVFMSKASRLSAKKLTKIDLLNKADEILKSIQEDFNAYNGTFSFDYHRQVVTHQIKVSYFHEWVGTHHERFCEFTDDGHLILKTPQINLEFKEGMWWFEILWRRKASVK